MFLPILLLADSLAAFMGPGISRPLAEYRARTLSEVRYDLRLDVTAPDSAVGHITIGFQRKDRADLILDFRGRRLVRASANGHELPADIANGAHLRIPAAALLPGVNRLEFDFVAGIAPSGTSIIRFHDQADGSDYLYTLLVPADANQLFPCFDQPDLKARVRFTLAVPAGWSAVANGSVAGADTAGSRISYRFTETRPISTYLIAFAAGPWHRATATANGRTVSAYVRRSRAREADLDTLLAINHQALGWMERYFGRRFPFEKFDFVLAPAFPFGGMEHPGAVFYNEDQFIFRERPTLPRRLGRIATVLHEVAHMWFGDLVTMRWFDDLWLKEGFATYMAAKALADLDSTSGAWKTFYLRNKPAAYGVDQTAGTTPVWQELANLDQAKSNYGPIVYNKAPSVLKQLNFLVGERAFRAGVRDFLARHAYGNATWRDLLGSVSVAAGRDLDPWGGQFILRPGMPQVEQQLVTAAGRITGLSLAQHPVQSLSGPGAWPMRTQVLLWYQNGKPVQLPAELKSAVTEVPGARGLPAPDFLFANSGDYGYMLTLLDSASVRFLETGGLGRIKDSFLRAMLWGALWDQVRTARMAPSRFVRLALAELPAERDEQIVPSVLARVNRSVLAYLQPAERAVLQPEVERLLWTISGDPSSAYGVRKAALDAFIETATTPDGLARIDTLLAADSAAGDRLRDPTRWAAVTRLLVLGAPGAEAALTIQRQRDTTPDGRRRAFVAGAARPTAETKREYFTRYFGDEALNEDWASGSLGAFNAVEHQALTLPYLRPALDSLRYIQTHRRIFFLGGWLDAFLSGQTGPEALNVVTRWLGDYPDLPADLRRKVLQYDDELERTVRIREAGSPPPSRLPAGPPAAPAAPVKVRVANGVYLYRTAPYSDVGLDGNSVVILSDDGVLVFDANGTPAAAESVLADIRRMTPQPVRWLVLSHWHWDHWYGAEVYRRAFPEVRIVAQEATRRLMMGPALEFNRPGLESQLPEHIEAVAQALAQTADTASGRRAGLERHLAEDRFFLEQKRGVSHTLPDTTFTDSLLIRLGQREVRVLHGDRAVTPGDAFLWLPQERIVVTGDLLVNPIPFALGCYPSGWIHTMEGIRARNPAILVPGHGEVLYDPSLLDAQLAAMQELLRLGREAHTQGLGVEQARATAMAALRPQMARLTRGDARLEQQFELYLVDWFLHRVYDEADGRLTDEIAPIPRHGS